MMFSILVVLHLWTIVYGQTGITTDYCAADTFNPTCGDNEVVMMQTAQFGLMRLGECLDEVYGHVGCSANILSQMDKKCSAKMTCEVAIITIKAKSNCTIPKTMATVQYLEAQYICKKVMPITKCDIMLKSGALSISSLSTVESNCGDDTRPLIIQAKPGQKINMSMTDFSWNEIHVNIVGCVQRYGYFIDVDKAVDICGKTKRNKHLLLSKGSSLQLMLHKNQLQDIRFLLTFQVIGCPTFEPPKDTWTKEDNGVVTVGCVHNDNTWKMRCIGNHWIGIQGQCNKALDTDDKPTAIPRDDNTVFGLPAVVGFSLIGGIFLIIICILVTTIIGFFCIRKQKPASKEYYLAPIQSSYNTTLPLDRATLPLGSTIPVEGFPSYRTVNRNGVTTEHNQTLLPRSMDAPVSGVEHNDLMQNNSSPHYFVLENRESHKEPIYDAVYQNVTDVNNA